MTHPLQLHQCQGHHRRRADADTVSPLHVQCSVAEFVACHMLTECRLATQSRPRPHISIYLYSGE